MGIPVFKRKIYNELLEWKEKYSDRYVVLVKGARRVGKSTRVYSSLYGWKLENGLIMAVSDSAEMAEDLCLAAG